MIYTAHPSAIIDDGAVIGKAVEYGILPMFVAARKLVKMYPLVKTSLLVIKF